jgi:hypothetical protein
VKEFMALLRTASLITILRSYVTCDIISKLSDPTTSIGNLPFMCILFNQRDVTYTVFFIIISTLHVSGGFSAHHQELIKLYVQP